jgi:hypothetical protein
MDERCMLMWVEEQIFSPYLLANPLPPGIQPVILLDAYRCHMMQSVVSKIAALGVEAWWMHGLVSTTQRRHQQVMLPSHVGGLDDEHDRHHW